MYRRSGRSLITHPFVSYMYRLTILRRFPCADCSQQPGSGIRYFEPARRHKCPSITEIEQPLHILYQFRYRRVSNITEHSSIKNRSVQLAGCVKRSGSVQWFYLTKAYEIKAACNKNGCNFYVQIVQAIVHILL